MIFRETRISGAWELTLERRSDERGYFARIWCADELSDRGLNAQVAQINTAFSPKCGTLRGLHYQVPPHQEVKVVRCLRGRVFDVIVDLRAQSPTLLQWVGRTLSADEGNLLYAPEGCAHGYLTLEPDCEVMYMASRPYAPDAARGVRFDDPAFDIEWPAPVQVISAADRAWIDFAPPKVHR